MSPGSQSSSPHALLLRGFHFLEKDRMGFPTDFRMTLPSLLEKMVRPLQALGETDIYLSTYPSPLLDELVAALKPAALILNDIATSNQIATYTAGVEAVQKSGRNYGKVICTRPDLHFLKSVDAWDIWDASGSFYFPWREYRHLWEDHHRVGDCIHVLDGAGLPAFRRALASHGGERKDMHLLYDHVAKELPSVRFIEQGFYDSNTMYANKEATNPLYRIASRPQLGIPNYQALPLFRCFGWKVVNFALKRLGRPNLENTALRRAWRKSQRRSTSR